MKNYKFLTITALFITILLAGCSDSTNGEKAVEKNIKEVTEENTAEQIKQEIPEPYTKAIIAINNKNWELANTYLDLVLSDYPDSEYLFPTQILKGSMQVSQFRGAFDLSDIIISGTDPNSSLYDADDKATISRHIDLINDIFDKSIVEQEATFTNIVQKFKVDKDYSEYYKDIMPFSLDAHYSNLSFFENVGYPIPSDSDIEEFLNTKYNINVSHMVNEITEKPEHTNYNYLLLFYNVGLQLNDNNPKLAKDLFNLILDITTDDIYNEYRISIEKLTKNSNN
ncbi:hypothetical protein ACQKII_03535 [Lysinibacillus sp. NPDC048646]|uniref:hypothetical protein n=1 Tax=Lysinibacillus sp. NPDC048646 TaxID=3390574 RepID=UPI003D008872